MVSFSGRSVSYLVRVYDFYAGEHDAAEDLAGEGISCGGAAANGGLSVPSFPERRGRKRRLSLAVLPDAGVLSGLVHGNNARSGSFGLRGIGVGGFSEEFPLPDTDVLMRIAKCHICTCVYFDSIAERRVTWSTYYQSWAIPWSQ